MHLAQLLNHLNSAYHQIFGAHPDQHAQQHAQQQAPAQRVSDQVWNATGGARVDPRVLGFPADNTARPPAAGPRAIAPFQPAPVAPGMAPSRPIVTPRYTTFGPQLSPRNAYQDAHQDLPQPQWDPWSGGAPMRPYQPHPGFFEDGTVIGNGIVVPEPGHGRRRRQQ